MQGVVLITVLLGRVLAAQEERYVGKHTLPDGRSVLVAEGELEPRSIGSYSLRMYGSRNPEFPMDDFLGGIICPRDGTIEKVMSADIDGDEIPELIVVIRNAGTGGYLSADAFNCREKKPILKASAGGLKRDADVVAALRAQCRRGTPPMAGEARSKTGPGAASESSRP